MFKYFEMPKESLDAQGNIVNIFPCETPDLSHLLIPFICDQDPDNNMQDADKMKHNSVHVFRFLREISYVDIGNFLGRPEANEE